MQSRSGSYKRTIKRSLLIVLSVALLALPVWAQPEKADGLLAEAKQLAASESNEQVERSFAKFEEAASLYRSAGNKAKADNADLEHGRTLRLLAGREMNSKRYDEA